MCLITYTPDKNLLDLEKLELAMENNPHGFGLVYAKDGSLNYAHRLAHDFALFKTLLNLVPPETPLGIHFRWATEGDKVHENLHPFAITSKKNGHSMDICVMHNGTFRGEMVGGYNHKGGESDTLRYVKGTLRPILQKHPELVHDEAFIKMIHRDVGGSNKLLFLTGEGVPVIINKIQGDILKESPDIWYSNTYSFQNNWRTQKKHYHHTPTTSPISTSTTSHSASPGVQNVYAKNENNTYSIRPSKTGIELPDDADLEKNIPAEIQSMLGPNETLLKRSIKGEQNPFKGFGWIHDGMTIYHSLTVATLHKKWYETKDKPSEPSTAPTNSQVPDKVTDLLAYAQQKANDDVKEQESKFDSSDFRVMNDNEILHWVIDYPKEASSWMAKNGFFASSKQIEVLLNEDVDFLEIASDFIKRKSINPSYVFPVERYASLKLEHAVG